MSKVIVINSGNLVNYRRDLHPDMLKTGGLKVPSAVNGVELEFNRLYVLDKIGHDVIDPLKIKSRNELIRLVSDAYDRLQKKNSMIELEIYTNGGFLLSIGKLTIQSIAHINFSSPYYQYGWFTVAFDENLLFEFGRE